AVSVAHQSRGRGSGADLALLYATGAGGRGVSHAQRRPGAAADLSPGAAPDRGAPVHCVSRLLPGDHAAPATAGGGRRLDAAGREVGGVAGGLMAGVVLEKLSTVQILDVSVPTTDGRELLLVRHTEPNREVALLLHQLDLQLPPQPPPKIRAPNPRSL